MERLEAAHYLLQKGIFFTGKKRANGAEMLYNDAIKDQYWNYATSVSATKPIELIREVECFYSRKHVTPSFYITPKTRPKGMSRMLARHGYRLAYSDAWMVYRGKALKRTEVEVREVNSKVEMRRFAAVFGSVYGKSGTGPYKDLQSGYAMTILASYRKRHPGRAVKYYLAYLNGSPVGCAMLIAGGKYAGLYGLGVLPRFRNRGVASALMAGRIQEVINRKASVIFLQTESGSKNERIFKRLGFRNEFTGRCFVKNR